MATPTFPTLNGQIKTAYRWYSRERDLNEYRLECSEDDAPECHWYALNTPNDRLPPFEVAFEDDGVIGSWIVYDLDGNEVADLTDDTDLLEVIPFEDLGYIIYEGQQLSTVLPAGVYKVQLEVDGAIVYSERVKVICGSLGVNQLENGFFTDGLGEWTFGGTDVHIAVRSTNTPGDPDDTGLTIGDIVLNFGDDMVYTYQGGGVFNAEIPEVNPSWYYDSQADNWYRWDGDWQSLVNDPIEVVPNGDTFLACWTGSAPVSLIHSLAGFDPGAYQVSVNFSIESTPGQLHVTGPGGIDFVSSGGSSVEVDIVIPAGLVDPIVLTPEGGWEGCIHSVTVRAYATPEECFATLRWSHCGNIGNVYYEEGFKNILYIDKRDTELIANPNILIQGEENAVKKFKETLRRRETTYAMTLGYLPWYLRDALAELPLCDLVELRMPGQTQYDQLVRPLVVFENDEVGDGACVALSTLTFQLDEASVTSACCVTFDPPCITPCTEELIFGLQDEPDPVVGEFYVHESEKTFAEFIGIGEPFTDIRGFGLQQECPSGLVQTDASLPDPFLHFRGGTWQPLVAILDMIQPTSCDGDAPFNITANIPGRYAGQPQVSLDGGLTWENVGNAFTADEWGSGVDVQLPEAGDFRILAVVNDCEVGWSASLPFDCCTGAGLTECVYYQDFREGGSDGQLNYEVSAFFVDGVDQLTQGVPFAGPLNVITVGGRPFVTNLIDALNKCDVCGFSFWPAPNARPIQGGVDRGGYFRLRRPTSVGFEIIIKTTPLGVLAYRYTDGDGSQYHDGADWANTSWPYQAETPPWDGAGPPEDCEEIS